MSCDVNIQGGVDVINSPNIQFLTAASGNYTVPAGKALLRGFMIGGGGGGGGVANGNASATCGATGVYQAFTMVVTPGQIIAFTCGALGAGGAAGNNNGVAGGDSTFGSLTSKGGVGGTGSASGNATAQTTALILSTLTASRTVPTATAFQTYIFFGSAGGAATGLGGVTPANALPWVMPAAQSGPNAAGGTGTGYGTSGGGATSTTGGAFAGGDGTAGAIMIIAE